MPIVRVENFPPFANNKCLGILIGDCWPFLSKIRWDKHTVSGAPHAFADLTCPEECVDEVIEKMDKANVLGHVLEAKRHEKPQARKQLTREEKPVSGNAAYTEGGQSYVLEAQTYDQPPYVSEQQISYQAHSYSEASARRYKPAADACAHCGSSAHFSRKCPNKNASKTASGHHEQATSSSAMAAVAESTERYSKRPKYTGSVDFISNNTGYQYGQQRQQQQNWAQSGASSDSCKYCGSTAHFSRRCSSKNSS